MEHVVIIGNGISGITCARNLRKQSDVKITIISSETKYFYSRTALMYVFMGHMEFEHTQPYENHFWEKNNLHLIQNKVCGIDTNAKTLQLINGDQVTYSKLVLALGSKSNMFGWPGQDADGVVTMYHKQDLEEIDRVVQRTKRAVLVGGGLIGVELAEMLISRGVEVVFLIREGCFWGNVLPKEEGTFISRHIQEDHHVDLRFERNLKSINTDEQGRVKSITIEETGEELSCEMVGLTAGVSPNIDWLKDTAIETKRGILVNQFLETNISDVYALGDCAEFSNPMPGRRPIEQVWYTGRMMGEVLANTLAGKKTPYDPGIWFNSAKFFDIEYQTYGTVLAELEEGQHHFFWANEQGTKCLKIVFEKESGQLIGVNSFGIRLRHHVMDQWLQDGKTIEHMLAYFKDVNFDPELYHSIIDEVIQAYEEQFKKHIPLKKKSWKRLLNLMKRA